MIAYNIVSDISIKNTQNNARLLNNDAGIQ